jgi:hypothetical protein
LRRVSFGLINPSATREFDSGQLWFDELRATDVAKDRGVAQRVLMSGRFANLAHYNVTWDGRSADFISVGQSRGSGVGNENLNFSGGFEPHRFFDGSGISVPLGFSYSRGTQQPRFSAGDDVVRVGALADASRSVSESRGFTTSYSRNWSDRANPFLRYTLGGISAGYTRNESESTSPSGASNSKNSSTSVSYGIAPRSLLRIALPLVNARFYPLPERFTIGYASASTESRTFTRSADGTQLFLQSAPRGRTTTVSIASDTRPLDFLHHHIDALRNLELPDAVSDRPSGINLGRVVSWRQSWDASFNLGKNEWLSPRVTTNSSYIQDNRPELSVRRDLSVKAINNAQAVTLNWSLPFDKLARPSAGGTTEIKRGIGFVPPRNPAAIVDSAAAVPDTAAKAAAPAKPRFAPDWRAFAWRIGRVSADASFDRNSSFTRLVGIPGPAYLFGLSDNPGLESDSTGRMREEFGNVASFGSSWRASARTRIVLVMDASINTQLEFTGRRNESSRVTTRTLTSRYPNLEFNYGRLAQALRLQRFVSNPQLRSSYQRSTTKDYRNSQTVPTGTATSSQWQPLLSLDGDLKNQTRVSFKVERRVTQRENFQNGRSRTTDRNTIFNLNLSRSYSKGQKVKFLNRESTVKTAVTLSLAASYDKQSGETIKVDVPGSRPQLPTDRDRLSINGTGTYSFSTNVNGSVRLGFGQNRDNKADRINRNVDVQIGASFTF